MIGLRAAAPVSLGDMAVIAVERVSILQSATGRARGRWIAAEKRPLAVCVVTEAGARAFDLDGSDLSLAWLCDRVPGLDEAVLAAGRGLPNAWPGRLITVPGGAAPEGGGRHQRQGPCVPSRHDGLP